MIYLFNKIQIIVYSDNVIMLIIYLGTTNLINITCVVYTHELILVQKLLDSYKK